MNEPITFGDNFIFGAISKVKLFNLKYLTNSNVPTSSMMPSEDILFTLNKHALLTFNGRTITLRWQHKHKMLPTFNYLLSNNSSITPDSKWSEAMRMEKNKM